MILAVHLGFALSAGSALADSAAALPFSLLGQSFAKQNLRLNVPLRKNHRSILHHNLIRAARPAQIVHIEQNGFLLVEKLEQLPCRNSVLPASAERIAVLALAAVFAQILALRSEMLAAVQLVDKSAENCFARLVFQLEIADSALEKRSDSFLVERFQRYQKRKTPLACLSDNCGSHYAVIPGLRKNLLKPAVVHNFAARVA